MAKYGYLPVFTTARDRLGLSNNENTFLTKILSICEHAGQRWYESKTINKIGTTAFLQDLARYVCINFTANGVGGLIKRLEEQGLVELDMINRRICVSDLFINEINIDRAHVNQAKIANLERRNEAKEKTQDMVSTSSLPIVSESAISKTTVKKMEEKQNPAIIEAFNEVNMPVAQTVEAYREKLETFVEIAEKEDKVKLTIEQETFLKGLFGILHPTEDQKLISEKTIQSLHNINYYYYNVWIALN